MSTSLVYTHSNAKAKKVGVEARPTDKEKDQRLCLQLTLQLTSIKCKHAIEPKAPDQSAGLALGIHVPNYLLYL